jgi:hypothetical protein
MIRLINLKRQLTIDAKADINAINKKKERKGLSNRKQV